jgi:hypothetical protein
MHASRRTAPVCTPGSPHFAPHSLANTAVLFVMQKSEARLFFVPVCCLGGRGARGRPPWARSWLRRREAARQAAARGAGQATNTIGTTPCHPDFVFAEALGPQGQVYSSVVTT